MAASDDRPLIYPQPQEIMARAGRFALDESVPILLPETASQNDRFLARMLQAHLADWRHVAVHTEIVQKPPEGRRAIVMGAATNPLVRQMRARLGLKFTPSSPGPEGYVLDISENGICIAGHDDRGAFYGLQSLRQLIDAAEAGCLLPAVRVRDWPYKPFRALRLYLPGRDSIPFFKRLIRDFAAYLKYNALVIETNAAIRLDRHPELNAGWYEFAKCLNYTRRDRPEGPGRQYQNSAHHDTGDFGVVEKEDVADLVACARRHFMEVIPEIPFLAHSYYLLTRHREFAEIQAAEWPDTTCPNVPEAYDLYFDVLDEYIELMRPRIIHIGHDEWRMPWDVCDRCRGQDPRPLFLQDLTRIHGYLQSKGVRTALWGDHLLESVREVKFHETTSPSGYKYRIPGGLTPEQLEKEVPRDLLVFNWFWNTAYKPDAHLNDSRLSGLGFEQVYGNLETILLGQDYSRRSALPGIIGGAVSSWTATTEFNFGKDLMHSMVGCAQMLWSTRWVEVDRIPIQVQSLLPIIRRNLRGVALPSEDGEAVKPLSVPAADIGVTGMPKRFPAGAVRSGSKTFDVDARGPIAVVHVQGAAGGASPAESPVIPVGHDASSLLFLHACAEPAKNCPGHAYIFNCPDTADLLGWYEVVYEDGLMLAVPLRYGVNILDWAWGKPAENGRCCYDADPIRFDADSAPITFFAHEWVNPRFGKVIRHIRLVGSRNFVSASGEPMPSNTVALLALSVVDRRPGPAQDHREDE